MNDPRLLIADEPTTALDARVQRQVLELLGELQREHGTAVLLVSHDLGVVAGRRTARWCCATGPRSSPRRPASCRPHRVRRTPGRWWGRPGAAVRPSFGCASAAPGVSVLAT
ncbi:hypothetical protein ACIG5E_02245 [Kitasatospora sp. NPDC053057]|uniref:hypothetical protein n=1 Tax=Kitasatospora sp. NPDC053057 TaxID=3364062 RepID=UPI0037C57D5C